jgi:WD40 repeat protein
MPQPNADDPFRTADHEPSAATPSKDVTAADVPASSVSQGHTGPYVLGAAPTPLGAAPGAGAISVPGYEIECVLGRGGMGVVYKARHLALKRTVALKMILAGEHAGAGQLARFRIEAEAAARLQHPNIVTVHEVGEAGGHPYCALELVEGGSLAGKLKGQPLPAREAAKLVEALARAMQLAHGRNVVHRDLKPANVLLATDGTPKITDFGLARQLDADSGETQAGQVMGTPSYMAPEQASGRAHEAGPAADVYALGAILYECLAGRPPFRGQTMVETLDLVRTQEPVPPSRLQAGVPLDLETICLKCLRKEPERRFASAAELADDLVRYQRGEPIQARPVGRLERAVKWVKRNPWLAGAAAVVVLAVGGGMMYGYLQYRETEAALATAKDALGREAARVKERDKANYDLTYQLGADAMVLANAAYDSGDFKLARERLDKVPEEQRRWEWRYLKRQLHGGIFTLYGHTGPVTCVAFSPDGTRIVTGGGVQNGQFEAKVWDARTGTCLFDLKGLPPSIPGANGIAVVSVAFSADSKRIVTAGGDKTARVYDATTGALQLELKEKQQVGEHVRSAAFSPDGTLIATGYQAANGGLVKVWDARTGKAVLEWQAHQFGTQRVAFSPDGTRIVTGGQDQAVKVWDAQTGTLLLDAKGTMSYDSSVTFSPDGKRIVAGREDGTARVIDARTGAALLELKGRPRVANWMSSSTQGALSVAFSPDDTRIVTGGTTGGFGTGEAIVWDARTGAELLELKGHTGWVVSAAFSPDGTRIITGSEDGSAKVWDARTGTPRLELEGIKGHVACAAFSPDGTWIVTGGEAGEATVWDARTGTAKFALQGLKGSVNSVAVNKDGTRIATGGGVFQGAAEATVWNAQTGQALLELKGLQGGVTSLAFSPDGERIITGGGDAVQGQPSEAKIWDARTGALLLDMTQPHSGARLIFGRQVSVAFSPDGKRALLGGARTMTSSVDSVALRDAQTGAAQLEVKDKQAVLSVAFSPDADRFATGIFTNTATVWNALTGKDLVELKGHTGSVNSVAFSPDGKRVVTGSGDRTVRVWDVQTGATLAELRGHTGTVTSVSFSADGTRLLTAGRGAPGKSGEVFVWDAPIPRPEVELVGHTASIVAVAFSPNADRIATASRDKTVRIWGAKTSTELIELKTGYPFLRSIAFSLDGTRLVTGGYDDTTKVWDAKTGQELKGEAIPKTVTSERISPDGHWFARVNQNRVEVVPLLQDEDELAYRRLHTQPKVDRYRAGYLAARAAKDDFAAAFYLNLIPPDQRKGVLAQADADAHPGARPREGR